MTVAAASRGRSGVRPVAALRRRWRGGRGDAGTATAELAVALPAVVLVLLAVLGAASAGSAALACADGARVGARSAALGLDAGQVVADARASAGAAARVEVSREGDWVTVEVERDVRWGGDLGGTFTVTGSASARAEPGT